MLHVKTPEEASCIIKEAFGTKKPPCVDVSIHEALGRTLAQNIVSDEYVPDFTRSTVDGFAVSARDTFGSSESIPAILQLAGEIKMGEEAAQPLKSDTCVSVPTGGFVPDGADAVVMLEHTEDYGDGTIGIVKSAAPGDNLIFRGDDVSPGKTLLTCGHVLTPHDIGALAALGIAEVAVSRKPVVGIISTGDELIDFTKTPQKGQIRDVNSVMLEAVIAGTGGTSRLYGIVLDDIDALSSALTRAVSDCDAVLISGGSSVGAKDATARIIESKGQILLHGIAMKPGKPTILGVINDKPIFGLPGHPVASYIVSQLFVRPLLSFLTGRREKHYHVTAYLDEALPSNHGRAEYIGAILENSGDAVTARPIHGKSGLITSLADSFGYICVPRDCEGLPKGAQVSVTRWNS